MIEGALAHLQRLPPDEALAALKLYEERRRKTDFIRYWEPMAGQTKAIASFTEKVKIMALVGGNRCLAAHERVLVPGGAVPIANLRPGDSVYAGDGSPTRVLEVYANGPRDVWRWFGRKRQTEITLDATANHRALTATQKDNTPQMRELGALGTRSYLVRADGHHFGTEKQPLALLVGLLLGDGYIAGNDLQWTCAEPDLVEELRAYLESLGLRIRSRGIQHYLANGVAIRKFLRDCGLWGCKSGEKFIPTDVWSWQESDVAALLGGLWATDGSVFESDGCWHASYTSKSRDLIEGLSDLQARGFGIYGSTILRGSKGTWNVTYGNRQALERLAQLPIPGRKGRMLRAVTTTKDSKGSLVPLADRQHLGEIETFDILVSHPSHTFLTESLVPVSNSGKTEAGAAIAAAWALGKKYFEGDPAWVWVKDLPIPEPPNTVWCVGLDAKVLQRVIWDEKLFRGRNHPGFVPQAEVAKMLEREGVCQLKNGSLITAMSAESGREKFQSASVDLVWIDEEPEEEIFDECFQRTIDCRGKILLTLTPLTDIASGAKTPWVFNLKEENRDDVRFANLSVLDNQYIPADELVRLQEKWAGHPEERARLYGEFVQRSGLVYNLFAPAVHTIEPRVLPEHWSTVVCIDPAPTGITAALWAKADGFGNLTFFREYYEPNLVTSAHAKNMLIRNQGQTVDMWLIDPKGGNQRNAETHKTIAQLYREAGIPVRLAEVGQDYGLNESLEYIAAALNPTARHPKATFFNDLESFNEEIRRYTWAVISKGERRGLTTGKPLKRNDHLMNCFQYICAMRPRARFREDRSPADRQAGARFQSYT